MEINSYQTIWNTVAVQTVNTHHKTLIIGKEKALASVEKLVDIIGEDQIKTCRIGEFFDNYNNQSFEIDKEGTLDYELLLQRTQGVSQILFLANLEKNYNCYSVEALEKNEHAGIKALFKLIKALIKPTETTIKQIGIITRGTVKVLATDKINNPFDGAIEGFIRAIRKEITGIKCTTIDIATNQDFPIGENSRILSAIATGKDLAIRREKFYEKRLKRINPKEVFKVETNLKSKGIYLIIGGTSGIGEQTAYYLAENYQAKIILWGRKHLNGNIHKILNRITEFGGESHYIKTNICDLEEVEQAVSQIQNNIGNVNGIFHSAIVLKDRPISVLTITELEEVLAPKSKGLINVANAFQHQKPEFLICYSSLNAFYANKGQSNYAAACTFKDTYTQFLRQENWNAKIINWGYWGEVGIVANTKTKAILEQQGIYSISVLEGMQAMHQIINSNADQCFYAKINQTMEKELNVLPTEDFSFSGDHLDKLSESYTLLDELSRYLVLNVFQKQNLFTNSAQIYNQEALKTACETIPKYYRLWNAIITLMKKADLIESDGDKIWLAKDKNLTVEAVSDKIKVLTQQIKTIAPDLTNHIKLVTLCTQQLFEMLSGRTPAVDVIFPKGSFEMVGSIYANNELSDTMNIELRKVLDQKLKEAKQPIKILEIGAGTGGTTKTILKSPYFKDKVATYCFTDLAVNFLLEAKKVFGNTQFEYEILNIEANPETQKITTDTYDLIIATNVLHAVKNIRLAVNNAKAYLKTGGTLLINELTGVKDFTTLIFGFLDGWWLYQDEELRIKNSPILKTTTWKQLLEEEGFEAITVIGNNETPSNKFQSVISSEKKAIATIQSTVKLQETSTVKENIITTVAKALQIEQEAIDIDIPFSDLGVDSIMGINIVEELNAKLSLTLKSADLFSYSTTRKLTTYITSIRGTSKEEIERPVIEQQNRIDENEIISTIVALTAATLQIEQGTIDIDIPFSDLGVDSIMGITIVEALNKELGLTLKSADLFSYSTTRKLATYIEGLDQNLVKENKIDTVEEDTNLDELFTELASATVTANEIISDTVKEITPIVRQRNKEDLYDEEDIAIIGMSGVFPGADTVEELWDILKNGKDMVTHVPSYRWDGEAYYDKDSNASGKSNSKWGAFIEKAGVFDPMFFNITPKEALMMDPQQRLFLRESWKALEDGGYTERQLNGKKVGVYVGVSNGGYDTLILEHENQNAQMFMGNATSILAARISYYLNLTGPSLAIDTACSSSLVALHNACQNIKAGDCEMAIVGGSCVLSTPDFYLRATKAGMLSPTGKCKTFDDEADGFVPGEAVGAILIKSAKKALEDNDKIYGIIKGTAVNQDGKSNGITAPSGNAQVNVISSLYKKLELDASSISYIETHGTGTKLGDPIEIDALDRVFSNYTQEKNYCPIGSIKTNLGHTLTSAGIVGLMKILLSFKNKQIAPSLHYKVSNHHLGIENTPFYVANQLQDWDTQEGQSRKAALSSFGFSGTNCHVVLEEPKIIQEENSISTHQPELFVFAAKTAGQLLKMLHQTSHYLKETIAVNLRDVAYTLGVKRNHFEYRIAIVAMTKEELLQKLERAILTKEFSVAKKKNLKEDTQEIHHILEPFLTSLTTVNSEEQRRKELSYLGDFFINGYRFDFTKLFENTNCKIADLPAYPFDEESYWIKSNTVKTNTTKATYRTLRYLTQDWTKATYDHNIAKDYTYQKKIGLYLKRDEKQIIALKDKLQALGYEIEMISLVQFVSQSILNEAQSVVDFTDTFSIKDKEEYHDQIQAIQMSLKTRADIKYIHFLNEDIGIATNYLAQGFYKMLSAEYSQTDIRSVLITKESLTDLPTIIVEETIKENKYGWYKYENRECLQPELHEINIENTITNKDWDTNGSYVFTGGLGDIGFEICKYILNKGVKHIIFLAERNLPETITEAKTARQKLKLERLSILKEKGAIINIHRGTLVADPTLEEFITVQQSERKIVGVFYCAGSTKAKHPAFMNKRIEEIDTIQNVKYEGFLNIIKLIPQPTFFVAFSSIASVSPVLGLGASDYAAANHFINAKIEALAKEGTHTRYIAIQWSNWLTTEMGSKVANKRIHELGIDGYQITEGLTALETIIQSNTTGMILPIIAITPEYNEDDLLRLPKQKMQVKKEEKKEKSFVKTIATSKGLITVLQDIFSRGLHIPITRLDPETSFNDFGIDSILIAELVVKIEKELKIQMNPTLFLEYPTVAELATYLEEEYGDIIELSQNEEIRINTKTNTTIDKEEVKNKIQTNTSSKNKKVAVIGMSCNFPGAEDIYQYWDNLKNGVNAISEIPESRWNIKDFFDKEGDVGKSYSKWGGFIKDIETFDYSYFGITKEEAYQFDPLVRQVLENAVQLLTHAGYQKEDINATKTGVYIGSRAGNFSQKIGDYTKNSIIGIGQNFIAAYLSHYLDLRGPSLVLDSACSSSLVSIHYAFESIKNGDCELAIAGGVDMLLDEKPYQLLSASKAISPEGKCKVFDKNADGFVPGEGCGLVLLKDFEQAQKDGDIIYGVIEATAVNNDGKTMGVTTPNFKAQYEVIKEAIEKAEIDPRQIGCIEAHGTGTMIGDPIELKALTKVFKEYTTAEQFCAIGSVKSNFGHLLSAAGIAAFQKMALSVHHGIIPPTLHCQEPNSRFKFETSPFYIAQQAKSWDEVNTTVRRTGMSGFGFGGTNCHIILRGLTSIEKAQYVTSRIALPLVVFNKERVWPTAIEKEIAIEETTDELFLELVEL